MPFRKRSKLLDQLVARLEKEEKPLQSLAVLGLIELLIERLFALVKIMGVILAFLFILVIGLELQVQSRNHQIDQVHSDVFETRRAANQAKDAADQADSNLSKAIAGAASGTQASADAIDSIHRMEIALCGGMCPAVPSTTTTTLPKGSP